MMSEHDRESDRRSGNRNTWILIGFLLIAAYFLIAEHKAHLSGYLQYWPLLLVLACPLLHLFMHRGRGRHGDHQHGKEGTRRE